MQPYEQRYKPWWYLQQAVEVDRIDAAVLVEELAEKVDRIDAAVLVEELAEIYSTPTPKGGRSRKSK